MFGVLLACRSREASQVMWLDWAAICMAGAHRPHVGDLLQAFLRHDSCAGFRHDKLGVHVRHHLLLARCRDGPLSQACSCFACPALLRRGRRATRDKKVAQLTAWAIVAETRSTPSRSGRRRALLHTAAGWAWRGAWACCGAGGRSGSGRAGDLMASCLACVYVTRPCRQAGLLQPASLAQIPSLRSGPPSQTHSVSSCSPWYVHAALQFAQPRIADFALPSAHLPLPDPCAPHSPAARLASTATIKWQLVRTSTLAHNAACILTLAYHRPHPQPCCAGPFGRRHRPPIPCRSVRWCERQSREPNLVPAGLDRWCVSGYQKPVEMDFLGRVR